MTNYKDIINIICNNENFKNLKEMSNDEIDEEGEALITAATELTAEFIEVEEYTIDEFMNDIQKIRTRYQELWAEASEREI